MKKLKILGAAMVLAAALWTVGCGTSNQGANEASNQEANDTANEASNQETNDTANEASNQETNDTANEASNQEEDAADNTDGQVATADEMADPVNVSDENMTPVYGNQIKDGSYEIEVDSSSSMFEITKCELIVEEGTMTAVMTMGGTGYLKVFMGTGEEAVNASKEAYIPFVENEDGAHTYTVPVEALDKETNCTAFSKRKEKWYDRVLIFRSDSLPQDALAEGTTVTVESLGLEDGAYTVDVRLEGGSGRASVETPTVLRIENGQAYAVIAWSSPNYDYMKVDGEKYDMVNTEGNSAFEIPVSGFDRNMAVIADTIAMSEPHEIEYTLYFDSSSIKKAKAEE